MHPAKLTGIILICAGGLGLAYGGFTYTRDTTGFKVGSMEIKVQEQQTVTIPLLVSAGAAALGVFLLVMAGRK